MAWMVLLAVIALPVVEIALFIKSAHWIGLLPTIALAVGAGFVGIALVRAQGVATLTRLRSQLDRGEVPLAEAFDGICLALAGGLLLLPGFFSDVIAIALLLPPVRTALRLWLGSRVKVATAAPPPARPAGSATVIDGDYRVVDHDDSGPRHLS